MWTALFWKEAGERAIRTFAQTFAASIVLGENALGLLAIDWADSASLSGGAALLTVLTYIAVPPRVTP